MPPWESHTNGESSGSGSDEESIPAKTWKKAFFNRLGDIKTFGDFACMTRYPQHVNPGLEVAGSLIPLPLVTRDADTIKSKCEQAPFGRGDDTVVDVSVRNTWQLDASLFRCSNPAWQAFLDAVLHEIRQKLGIPKGTRAVPWKLLLYEEGSFFRPHKDSEKAPGMIGTLVISLPTKHEGGEVHLSHSNRRHVFATSDFSSFDLTALAWYSDVTHEIKPLSSGYRLVITYNLLQQGASAPSAGVFIKHQAQLQALLQKWTSAMPSKTRIIHRLDHKYSESSLSIQNMKGRDAQLVRCLKQACQETGFYLLLAMITKTESDEDDYYGGGDEDSLQLDYIASLEGNHITRSIDVEMNEILGPDPYKNRTADSEDEGEFTGNESAPSEYRYHDSALLIVPRRCLIDLAKSSQCSAANLFRMVFESTAASPNDLPTRREALSFLGSLLEDCRSPIREGRLLSMVFRASKLWCSQALYTKAMRRALKEAQGRTRHQFSYQLITAGATGSPTKEISVAVAELANEFFSQPTDQDWNECLGELVQGLDNLASLNVALKDVEMRLQTKELRKSFRYWRSSVEISRFEAKDILTALDLPIVLSLIQSHSTNDEWISTRLLPKLSQHAEKQLLFPLLHKLCAENDRLALKNTESLARRLLDATILKLNLEIDDLEPKSQRPPQNTIYIHGASNDTYSTMSNVTGFAHLLESCFMCLLNEQADLLLKFSHENLSETISRLPPAGLERNNTMQPLRYSVPTTSGRAPAEEFLVSLVIVLNKYSLSDLPPVAKDLFKLLFTRYILPDQPKSPPQRPLGWSHKPRFCHRHNPSGDKTHGVCYECGLIQDFIRAPDQAQGRFTYAKNIRSHLESVLPRKHYRCTTDTSRGRGNCQTLVVTKIGRGTEFKEDMSEFNDEMRKYEQRLLPFRQPVVQRLLGNETYNSLIMVEPAPPGVSTARASTKRAAGETSGQPTSTRQRTEEVIDLTGE